MLTTPVPSSRSQSPAPAPPPASIADVLDHLRSDHELDEQRRKACAGALRTLCSALGREASAVPASFREIDALLAAVPASARGRSKKSIDNARSLAKAALRRYSKEPGLPPRGTPLNPAWQGLADRLPDLRLRNGLSRFMRIASFHGCAPEDIDDAAVDRIVELARQVNWGRDVKSFRAQATGLWNEAVDTVPGWPTRKLTPPTPRAREAHLPISAFPDSFQRELAAYLSWARGDNPLAKDAPAQALKASTLRLREHQLRIAASVLASQLGGASSITSLEFLVKPEHVKQVLTSFLKTGPEMRVSAFTRGLSMTLKTVAKQWVGAPQADLDELARIQRKLGSAPSGLTAKNRKLIRQFDDPRVLAQLLNLPAKLREQTKTQRLSPQRRLQRMQMALAIELLLCAPIRINNLSALRMDQHIEWPSGWGGPAYIVLNNTETKNDMFLEYPLPDHARDLMREYLDRYRSYADGGDSPWLFVKMGGAAVSAATLRDGIKKAIKRELGIDMTPHQFRHLAAAIALDHHPGAIGLVRDLLGHKNIKTTVNSYAGMRTREAGQAYDKLLASRRLTGAEH